MRPNAVSKLPKWAQEYIEDIERERDIAIRELNKNLDSETESPVYIESLVSTGEAERGPSFKTRYVQTRHVAFKWLGVHLTVRLSDEGIDLQWGSDKRSLGGDVAMIPKTYQQVALVAKERMRN